MLGVGVIFSTLFTLLLLQLRPCTDTYGDTQRYTYRQARSGIIERCAKSDTKSHTKDYTDPGIVCDRIIYLVPPFHLAP